MQQQRPTVVKKVSQPMQGMQGASSGSQALPTNQATLKTNLSTKKVSKGGATSSTHNYSVVDQTSESNLGTNEYPRIASGSSEMRSIHSNKNGSTAAVSSKLGGGEVGVLSNQSRKLSVNRTAAKPTGKDQSQAAYAERDRVQLGGDK